MHDRRLAESRALEHRRPEQRMEIQDVLADEVPKLRLAIGTPEIVEDEAGARAEILEARHVADRRVEPDIEVLARRIGDLDAEVGRVAGHVPVPEAGVEPLVQLVGDRRLQAAGARPLAQHRLEIAQLEEDVLRFAQHRGRARHRRDRVDQVGRRIGRAAVLAAVAVLVGRRAARAGALDVAVGQEHAGLLVIGLADDAPRDVARGRKRAVHAHRERCGSPREWVV